MQDAPTVTELLRASRGGNREALDRLFSLLYDELRRVAHRQLLTQQRDATQLAEVNERLSRAMGCRFFGGLSIDETATALNAGSRKRRECCPNWPPLVVICVCYSKHHQRRSTCFARGQPLASWWGAAFSPSVPATTILRSRARALARKSRASAGSPGVGLDPLLAHARHIPGFGGFFLDQTASPPLPEKTPASGERRKPVWPAPCASWGCDLPASDPEGGVRLPPAQRLVHPRSTRGTGYSRSRLRRPDEGSNRLRLGVETAAAERSVRELLARRGIPECGGRGRAGRAHP